MFFGKFRGEGLICVVFVDNMKSIRSQWDIFYFENTVLIRFSGIHFTCFLVFQCYLYLVSDAVCALVD